MPSPQLTQGQGRPKDIQQGVTGLRLKPASTSRDPDKQLRWEALGLPSQSWNPFPMTCPRSSMPLVLSCSQYPTGQCAVGWNQQRSLQPGPSRNQDAYLMPGPTVSGMLKLPGSAPLCPQPQNGSSLLVLHPSHCPLSLLSPPPFLLPKLLLFSVLLGYLVGPAPTWVPVTTLKDLGFGLL